ncbi:MAG: hypothetical protein Tsb005_00970 [Gammaproteobacteria bacterium]
MTIEFNELKNKIQQVIALFREQITQNPEPKNEYNFFINLLLEQLKRIFDNNSTSEKNRIDNVKNFLAKWWTIFKKTSVSYTAIPDAKVTVLMCELAVWVVENTQASEEISALRILMPTVKSVYGVDTTKNKMVLATNVVAELLQVLNIHIIGGLNSDAQYLIPVGHLLDLYGVEVKATISNQSLTSDEQRRLAQHSALTQQVTNAYEQFQLALKKNFFLELTKFSEQLKATFSKTSQNKSAELVKHTAEFRNYYISLEIDNAIKNTIDNWLAKLKQLLKDSSAVTFQLDVEYIADQIQNLVKEHKQELILIKLKEHKQMRVLPINETQALQKYQQELAIALSKSKYTGKDKIADDYSQKSQASLSTESKFGSFRWLQPKINAQFADLVECIPPTELLAFYQRLPSELHNIDNIQQLLKYLPANQLNACYETCKITLAKWVANSNDENEFQTKYKQVFECIGKDFFSKRKEDFTITIALQCTGAISFGIYAFMQEKFSYWRRSELFGYIKANLVKGVGNYDALLKVMELLNIAQRKEFYQLIEEDSEILNRISVHTLEQLKQLIGLINNDGATIPVAWITNTINSLNALSHLLKDDDFSFIEEIINKISDYLAKNIVPNAEALKQLFADLSVDQRLRFCELMQHHLPVNTHDLKQLPSWLAAGEALSMTQVKAIQILTLRQQLRQLEAYIDGCPLEEDDASTEENNTGTLSFIAHGNQNKAVLTKLKNDLDDAVYRYEIIRIDNSAKEKDPVLGARTFKHECNQAFRAAYRELKNPPQSCLELLGEIMLTIFSLGLAPLIIGTYNKATYDKFTMFPSQKARDLKDFERHVMTTVKFNNH